MATVWIVLIIVGGIVALAVVARRRLRVRLALLGREGRVKPLKALAFRLICWVLRWPRCKACTAPLTRITRSLGICSLCMAEAALEPYRAEFTRLLAKRNRYASAGASPSQVDLQGRRFMDRLHSKVATFHPELREAAARIVIGWSEQEAL
jgi:hypothetical protein